MVATVSSCTNDEPPVIILGILAPPTPTGSGATACCVYTTDIKGPFLSASTVDFAFTRQYTPVLLLGNQLIPTTRPPTLSSRPRSSSRAPSFASRTPTETNSTTTRTTGFLPRPIGGELGLGTYETTLISSAVADQLGAFSGTKRLVSYVKV